MTIITNNGIVVHIPDAIVAKNATHVGRTELVNKDGDYVALLQTTGEVIIKEGVDYTIEKVEAHLLTPKKP